MNPNAAMNQGSLGAAGYSSKVASAEYQPRAPLLDVRVTVHKADNGFIVQFGNGCLLVAASLEDVRDLLMAEMAAAKLGV